MMADRLWLRLDAPFAAFRTFTAGWYRPTAEFLTHSAVYGLLLNVAGIDARVWEHEDGHDGKVPASLTREGLPSARIALGIPAGHGPPSIQTVYQQLHNYPVGRDAGMPAEMAKGRKNNITPVRREFLHKVHAVVVVESEASFLSAIQRGLRGEGDEQRYGLPFLGDNSFLPDRLEVVAPMPARWYERVEEGGRPREGTTRLTLQVDRAGMTGTVSALFAPGAEAAMEIPDTAWGEVGGG